MEMARAVRWLDRQGQQNDFSAGGILPGKQSIAVDERCAADERNGLQPSPHGVFSRQIFARKSGTLTVRRWVGRYIVRIVRHLISRDPWLRRDITARELCGRMGQNSKSVEQRRRRAASVGVANLA
ncbi:MAG: hypothetical protein ACLR0U_14800 [Enterocloster clostridioformis]